MPSQEHGRALQATLDFLTYFGTALLMITALATVCAGMAAARTSWVLRRCWRPFTKSKKTLK